jgi:hypothetical protein
MERLSLKRLSVEGLQERAPVLGTLKDRLSKAVEWTSVSIGTLLLGNIEGRPFYRAFEIKRHIKIYVKMSCKQGSLSIRALLWNMEGICWLELSGEKRVVYLDSFLGHRGY